MSTFRLVDFSKFYYVIKNDYKNDTEIIIHNVDIIEVVNDFYIPKEIIKKEITFIENPLNYYFHNIIPFNMENNQKTNIYSYSFALTPQDFQPSGSINFSKINNIYH